MISQGPEELNIIVGVDNADFEKNGACTLRKLCQMTERREHAMKNPNVTILGATGAVGREMLKILEERSFPLVNCAAWPVPAVSGKSCLLQGEKSW